MVVVIDAAKVMAIDTMNATNPGDLWDYVLSGSGKGLPVKNAALPLVAITTTAGTGSEVDAYGVITKPDTNVKVKHFFHDFGKNFFLSAVRTFLVGTVNRILS